MYGHLLPTIEVSRPASRASVKQDLSQFQQESQSPEVVNESTILSPTDQSAPVFYQPTPDNSVAHEAIPENVEPQDLTPYKFRWEIFDRDSTFYGNFSTIHFLTARLYFEGMLIFGQKSS